jgi:hypothetical protein
MAILKVVKEINGQDCVIGFVCELPNGKFWFNPKMSNHKPSRKQWDKATDAIPRWANNMADRIDDMREVA